MKRYIKSSSSSDLADVYAKTIDGDWVLIFKDIPEEQATAIWYAGFKTGQNRISVKTGEGAKIAQLNKAALGIRE